VTPSSSPSHPCHDHLLLRTSSRTRSRLAFLEAAASDRKSRNKNKSNNSPPSIKSTKLDENVKNRLVKETIAPWRPLRLFLYFALGSGALLGGFITLTGTLAALSGARTDVDLNTEVRCVTAKQQSKPHDGMSLAAIHPSVFATLLTKSNFFFMLSCLH
jgi:hypothetical protein